jgi:hypothetical protein
VIEINLSDFYNSKIVDFDDTDLSVRSLDLNLAEREILLKACRMYRARIPGYLKSKQAEIQIINDIIQKLT